jgi:hypothetical protein
MPVVVGPPYTTVQEAIEDLTRIEAEFLANHDRRGVSVIAYRTITTSLDEWIAAGKFADNEWVTTYVISFANLYREVLERHLAGLGICPAWRISLETSAAGTVLVAQDLMLAVNAHVNRDLPFALLEVGADSHRADHTLVNQVLKEATDIVLQRIASYYAAGLGLLAYLLGDIGETFLGFNSAIAGEHAWQAGVALNAAATPEELEAVAAMIDAQAKLLARSMLFPNSHSPWLIHALRHLEQMKPWYEVLQIPSSEHVVPPA